MCLLTSCGPMNTEESTAVVHGLWNPDFTIDAALSFVVEHGFNAIRLPFAISTVLSNPLPKQVDLASEPSLLNLSMLDVLETIIHKAGERNILIMLDGHRLRPEAGISPLWYDSLTSELQVKEAWSILATRFCATAAWNVFAADLKNEPHGDASWGSNNLDTDWRLAAERLGNHVLSACPRWLIFVEGVEKNIVLSRPAGQQETENGWWGGKLQGIQEHPIRLMDPTKLVFSPHVYGPSVYLKDSFVAPNYPDNLDGIWDADFGFASAKFPLVIGEWGGHLEGRDAAWFSTFLKYMDVHDMGQFYWSLNPNQDDTGGLLQGDWKTPERRKLDLLDEYTHGTSVEVILQAQ